MALNKRIEDIIGRDQFHRFAIVQYVDINTLIEAFRLMFTWDILSNEHPTTGDDLQKSTHRNSAVTNRVRLHCNALDII